MRVLRLGLGRRRQPLQPLSRHRPGGERCRVSSAPIKPSNVGSLSGLEKLQLETPFYKPQGTNRYAGPALPPNGRPDTVAGLEKLDERLIRLAFGGRPEGHNAPPLETYTTTASEHGDVVRATEEYVRWFRRTYSISGPEDRVGLPTPSPSSEGMGRKPSRWRQNDIAP